jgi:hypothetical protein
MPISAQSLETFTCKGVICHLYSPKRGYERGRRLVVSVSNQNARKLTETMAAASPCMGLPGREGPVVGGPVGFLSLVLYAKECTNAENTFIHTLPAYLMLSR